MVREKSICLPILCRNKNPVNNKNNIAIDIVQFSIIRLT